jgi:hypothetical protein
LSVSKLTLSDKLVNHLRQIYDNMKLPKPRKRGTNWHIEFMLNGKRYSSTHDTPIQAKDWAMRKIVSLKDDAKRIDSGELPRHTLKELCDIYLRYLSKKKAMNQKKDASMP